MKKWVRPTQLTKKFPADKYGFSKHLKKVGDWIETHPFPEKQDAVRMLRAAHHWAWYYGYRVSVEIHEKTGGWIARIFLTDKVRIRDYG